MKVQIFGGFAVESPTKKANRLKALLRGISLSEYGSEGFRVRLRGLSEYPDLIHHVNKKMRLQLPHSRRLKVRLQRSSALEKQELGKVEDPISLS